MFENQYGFATQQDKTKPKVSVSQKTGAKAKASPKIDSPKTKPKQATVKTDIQAKGNANKKTVPKQVLKTAKSNSDVKANLRGKGSKEEVKTTKQTEKVVKKTKHQTKQNQNTQVPKAQAKTDVKSTKPKTQPPKNAQTQSKIKQKPAPRPVTSPARGQKKQSPKQDKVQPKPVQTTAKITKNAGAGQAAKKTTLRKAATKPSRNKPVALPPVIQAKPCGRKFPKSNTETPTNQKNKMLKEKPTAQTPVKMQAKKQAASKKTIANPATSSSRNTKQEKVVGKASAAKQAQTAQNQGKVAQQAGSKAVKQAGKAGARKTVVP